MKLIIVTRQIDGEKMYVNPEQICAIYPYHKKESTVIQFSGTKEKYLDVKESPESIACMIADIEPERKTGKWVPHIEKSREYIGTVLVSVEYDYWLCDACGYRVENGQPVYSFCPNCGAMMLRGEEE